METNNNQMYEKSDSIKFNLLYCFIVLTIISLFFKIDLEMKKDFNKSLNTVLKKDENFFLEIKKYSSVGWFELEEYVNYDKSGDNVYLNIQYLIAPTILENYAFNKIIICHYPSQKYLSDFLKKNKRYKVLRKDILINFALLERIN